METNPAQSQLFILWHPFASMITVVPYILIRTANLDLIISKSETARPEGVHAYGWDELQTQSIPAVCKHNQQQC